MKIEPTGLAHSKLRHEWNVYQDLGQAPGIPRAIWFGAELGYRAIVMDLLGSSLEELFNLCNRKFSLKTVLMIGDQMVS